MNDDANIHKTKEHTDFSSLDKIADSGIIYQAVDRFIR